MNVDSIQGAHWDELSNLALPLVQQLRGKWMRLNIAIPPGYERRLQSDVLANGMNSVNTQVADRFYSELYSRMTAGLGYALNFPGEPDAAWAQVVAAWQAIENTRAGKPVVVEPASNARWVPDQERAQCRKCRKDFGVFTRRHHCRLCGEVFCDNCTRKQLDIKNPLDAGQAGRLTGLQRNQRVCDECYEFRIAISPQELARNNALQTPARVQQDNDSGTPGARLWEQYTAERAVSRFQFVVTEGGGVVLLSRLNRVFQMYFHDNPDARRVFNGWKIFGEEAARGRSDSCVIYLLRTYRDDRVQTLWNRYILANRDLRRSVSTHFIAPGLFHMGNGAWAIDLPEDDRQMRYLGEPCGGSAGDFIAKVLGEGYSRAAKFFHDKPDKLLSLITLRDRAKHEVRDLVDLLYVGIRQSRTGARLT